MDEILDAISDQGQLVDRPTCAAKKVGMVLQRANGAIEMCNSDAEQILGLTLEQMCGWSSIDFSGQAIHADGSPFAGETHPAVETLRTGQPCQNVVMGLYRPDGSLIWLSIDTQPLFQAQSSHAHAVISTFADITLQQSNLQQPANAAQKNSMQGRQSMLESLRQNQQFTDHLINMLPGVLHLFDAIEGRTLFISEQALPLLGYPPAQIVEMGQAFLDQVMHPDDRARLQQHFDRLQSQADELLTIEYRMRHANGEWRWFSSQDRVFCRTADGQVQQVLGIAQDISAAKRLEEGREAAEVALHHSEETAQQQLAELEFIYATAPIGLCFIDAGWRFVRMNDHLAEINGLPAADHIGRTVREIIPEMADQLEPLLRQAIETGKPILDLEISGANQAQPGVRRDWLVSYYPLKRSDGQVLGINAMVQEITDRRRTEEAARQRDQRLSIATSAVGLGVFEWNALSDTNIWENQRVYEIFGHTLADGTIGQAEFLNSVIHPDDRPAFEQAYEAALRSRTVFYCAVRIRRRDGEWRWVEFNAQFKFAGDNTFLGVLGVVGDITDRKQIEIDLQQSNAILNAINESTPTLIYVKDRQGRMLFANPATLAAIDKPAAAVLGVTSLEFHQPREAAEQIMANDRFVIESGQTVSFEEVFDASDRQIVFLSVKSPYRDSEGNVIGLIGISSDISDRKATEAALRESEAKYRILTEAIPQFVFVSTADGDNEYVNQQFCDYTGCSMEQLLGAGWLAIVHPDDLERSNLRWQAAVQSGAFYEIEYRFRRADGQYRWFLGQGIPLKDEQGQVVKWFGTCTDIHEQKQIEADRLRLFEQEQIAREQAEQANRIKDEFLAILSHELRTPLNPILGWSKLLQTRQFTPDKLKTALATIERNAQLQVQLIDDLLDVSRIIRGKLMLDLNSVCLQDTIESAIETIHLAAEAKSIAIETHFDPQVGAVLGDAGRLQQIVWNLLSNAVKFTPSGGRVTVQLEAGSGIQGSAIYPADASLARLTITDTGKGIVPEFLPHIFEAFRQQDGSTTRQFGGLGLGLAIVRQLVELHGGTIIADSLGEGRGATFTLWLPMLQMHQPIAPLTHSISDLQNIRVLAVDDEADSLEILTVLLEHEGAIVTPVTSTRAAIDRLNQSQFDVLVSDIGMPEADGYVLMAQVRALPSEQAKIPAVALTAYAGEGDQQQILAAGYQRHLPKPIEPDLLIAAISQLVSQPAAR